MTATATKPVSVLVTDDESNIRLLLRTALEYEGYAVSEAADGRQALDAVRQHTPDLMVLDLNMPVLDGMAVLEQMKLLSIVNKPRIIVLTAYGSIPTAVRATRLGASDFLEKPITPSVLRDSVHSLLTEPELDGSPVTRPPASDYDLVLGKARRLLRLAKLEDAEQMLMAAADRRGKQSAAYFNLLGILYEAQHRWRLARKCYGKALDADEHYEPAKNNLLRVEELHRHGKSDRRVVLGDEPQDVWYAQMPATGTH